MLPDNPGLPSQIKGQFVLTAETKAVPEGWSAQRYNEWNLFTTDLAVIDVFSESQEWLGWCIGHPVVDGILEPENIVLKNPENVMDPYDNFYDRATGKWILILLSTAPKAIYLDSYGSLPAVFSTIEKSVAATPALIGSDADWDTQLMAEIGFPEKLEWLPSGLTLKKNVHRLIANHTLNLLDWKVSRHWPTPETDFSIDNNTEGAVARIAANIRNTITAVSKRFPLCLTITGGMDSRVVLACARNHIQKAKIITFAETHETLDMLLAKLLAEQLNLDHMFLPKQTATPEELSRWQLITGKSVAGDIWKIHKTLTQLDSDRVLMTGQSGEVHRGNYWRPGDMADSKITAAELLKRCKFPIHHPIMLKATEAWLGELDFVNTFVMLDLVHIEQRMSCWGALQSYGNVTSAFEISPLSSRLIFKNMMRLPHVYRKKQQLPYDICKTEWPELVKLPFNEYPGIYGYFRSKYKKAKKIIKRMVR